MNHISLVAATVAQHVQWHTPPTVKSDLYKAIQNLRLALLKMEYTGSIVVDLYCRPSNFQIT